MMIVDLPYLSYYFTRIIVIMHEFSGLNRDSITISIEQIVRNRCKELRLKKKGREPVLPNPGSRRSPIKMNAWQ